jgi:hypothetical protein
VAEALADRAQRQIVQAGLPKDPNGYEIKLPEGFRPPEGMQFEINQDDPALAQFRAVAHKRGLDQETFSEALGIYASTKVEELRATNAAREDQLNKLGAAGPQRIDAIEKWLKSKVGDNANIAIATLKQFPVAANVEMFEGIIRAFSSQGNTGFSQSGREGQEDQGKIPGYENLSFVGRRIAQMTSAPAKPRGDRR